MPFNIEENLIELVEAFYKGEGECYKEIKREKYLYITEDWLINHGGVNEVANLFANRPKVACKLAEYLVEILVENRYPERKEEIYEFLINGVLNYLPVNSKSRKIVYSYMLSRQYDEEIIRHLKGDSKYYPFDLERLQRILEEKERTIEVSSYDLIEIHKHNKGNKDWNIYFIKLLGWDASKIDIELLQGLATIEPRWYSYYIGLRREPLAIPILQDKEYWIYGVRESFAMETLKINNRDEFTKLHPVRQWGILWSQRDKNLVRDPNDYWNKVENFYLKMGVDEIPPEPSYEEYVDFVVRDNVRVKIESLTIPIQGIALGV